MEYVEMGIWLSITVWLISWIDRRKDRMIPVCIIYYFITVINDIFFMSTLELANAFGISYQLGDLMMLLFASTFILDIVRKKSIKRNNPNALITIIFVIMLISILSGVLIFGFSSEWLGDIRTLFGFIMPIIWFVRFFKVEYVLKYMKLIDKVMLYIAAISIFLWGIDLIIGFHPLKSQYEALLSDGGSTMRFISSYQVFGIAIYALFLTRKNLRNSGVIGIKAYVFLGMVILFQHRSVWMALALGIIMIIMQESKNKKNTVKLVGQMVLLILIGTAFLLFSNGDLVKNIIHSWDVFLSLMSGNSVENTTAGTRTQIWHAVINDLNGITMLIGRPFGYGYGRSIGWMTSPHSGYIRLIARIGYIGISIFIILLVWILVRVFKKTPYIPEFILCFLGFIYGYDATWLCGCVIGASIGFLVQRKSYGKLIQATGRR